MAEAEGIPLPTPADERSRSARAGLVKRVLSTVILLPVFLAIVLVGPVWLFAATIVLVGAAAQWEFTGMFERAGIRTCRVVGLVGGVVVTASFAVSGLDAAGVAAALTAALLALLTVALCRQGSARVAWEPFAVTALGIAYVNWLLGYGFWLRELPFGREWVLLLVWVTWLGETAAYLVGSTVGRHPLAWVISPKKTIEGSLAQFAMSLGAAAAAQVWFFGALPLGHALMVGAALGVVGQVGDLVESALKRSVGTKDTGQLIPGHGGLLDRIDSLLFNTPVLFYCASHGRMLGS
jgi:phosphatidate cytidylyltransferase